MRKVYILTILIASVLHCYSQIDVDSIKINSESVDSMEIIVYTTFSSCYLVDSTRYALQQDSMFVSFYYSEEFPQCDCSPCQRQDFFKIKKNTFKKVVFNSFIRYCIDNCTSYSEYVFYSKGVLWLTSVDLIDIENECDVNISPNPVRDELLLTRNKGGAVDIKIFDLNGNTLFEKKIYNSESINISKFPTGLYFVAINHKTVYKLVKY